MRDKLTPLLLILAGAGVGLIGYLLFQYLFIPNLM
ncbi:hypothetical protein BpOF4_17615 [Alkalihalophilus pseudofirmus OF4]|jgi:hypothetical protein|uniref:Uncharacterized protein n=2 Tax=Alkalihalophilus TaxID=2893060 RepID=D3FRH3_ALKPO|nr:hypothetical protein BpOF4_17615 [Alkalihalophilus pseudofirmus OF4]ERN53779.1 hypothetical protein A33I_09885 [Alkalihalophilus marmarensis DSM 21297]